MLFIIESNVTSYLSVSFSISSVPSDFLNFSVNRLISSSTSFASSAKSSSLGSSTLVTSGFFTSTLCTSFRYNWNTSTIKSPITSLTCSRTFGFLAKLSSIFLIRRSKTNLSFLSFKNEREFLNQRPIPLALSLKTSIISFTNPGSSFTMIYALIKGIAHIVAAPIAFATWARATTVTTLSTKPSLRSFFIVSLITLRPDSYFCLSIFSNSWTPFLLKSLTFFTSLPNTSFNTFIK